MGIVIKNTIIKKIWWKYIPGITFKVRWPVGDITVNHTDPRWQDLGGAVWIKFESADPNDHYRPTLENLVGRQGWDWDWDLTGNDIENNQLTIKIRKKHAKIATMLSIKWA